MSFKERNIVFVLLASLTITGVAASLFGDPCEDDSLPNRLDKCMRVPLFIFKDQRCSFYRKSLRCLEELVESCPNFETFSYANALDLAKSRLSQENCDLNSTIVIAPPPPSPSPTTPPPKPCLKIQSPELSFDSTIDPIASIPDTFRPHHRQLLPQCSVEPHATNLEHCSVFSYSHLRAFKSGKLSTCFIPGSWYLMKYPGLVEVIVHNSVPRFSVVEDVTRIDNVTVVFPPNDCHGNTMKVYTAGPGNFPHTFLDGSASDEYSIELNTTDSYAAIRSHAYNITIAICSAGGHLSVAIQAPEHLIVSDGGLCQSGCPSHAQGLDVVGFGEHWCSEATRAIFLACAYRRDILNGHVEVANPSYFDVCQFDVLKDQDYQMIHINVLASQDALILGTVAAPETPSSLVFNFQRFAEGNRSTNTPHIEEPSPQDIHIQLGSGGQTIFHLDLCFVCWAFCALCMYFCASL